MRADYKLNIRKSMFQRTAPGSHSSRQSFESRTEPVTSGCRNILGKFQNNMEKIQGFGDQNYKHLIGTGDLAKKGLNMQIGIAHGIFFDKTQNTMMKTPNAVSSSYESLSETWNKVERSSNLQNEYASGQAEIEKFVNGTKSVNNKITNVVPVDSAWNKVSGVVGNLAPNITNASNVFGGTLLNKPLNQQEYARHYLEHLKAQWVKQEYEMFMKLTYDYFNSDNRLFQEFGEFMSKNANYLQMLVPARHSGNRWQPYSFEKGQVGRNSRLSEHTSSRNQFVPLNTYPNIRGTGNSNNRVGHSGPLVNFAENTRNYSGVQPGSTSGLSKRESERSLVNNSVQNSQLQGPNLGQGQSFMSNRDRKSAPCFGSPGLSDSSVDRCVSVPQSDQSRESYRSKEDCKRVKCKSPDMRSEVGHIQSYVTLAETRVCLQNNKRAKLSSILDGEDKKCDQASVCHSGMKAVELYEETQDSEEDINSYAVENEDIIFEDEVIDEQSIFAEYQRLLNEQMEACERATVKNECLDQKDTENADVSPDRTDTKIIKDIEVDRNGRPASKTKMTGGMVSTAAANIWQTTALDYSVKETCNLNG